MRVSKKDSMSLKLQIEDTLRDRTLEKSDRRYLKEKLKRIKTVIKEFEDAEKQRR